MTFGYALLGALVLLLPGFAGFYGVRLGEASDLVSPRPDRPNSNQTIFLVVALALVAHLFGAILFAANEQIAAYYPLFDIGFEPNPYKILIAGHAPAHFTSTAFAAELVYFFLLTVGMGWFGEATAKWNPITVRSQPLRFGWLLPMVRQVELGSHIVIGYVMTTTGNDGAWLAYEGMVRRLALNDDDGIEMIVLEQCDRFLVRIDGDAIERVDTKGAQPIELMQLRSDQIANCALEVIEVTARSLRSPVPPPTPTP